ncbi:ABC-F family ATP-binding cassette domain-containing protein [Massilimicrobiota timonensis]|uniref:ABC transporter ATP-binding protein n=1 Tax=Massilimicrobiota timonensis TaxID=1776392 RepID=A0A1Y4SZ06_9FIRM|nr:ATP-binding cassette domain-containing protein [Massilimicrobiota timonensis]OUQ34003.1 ABC transporter ATP-binding protein [Massilimicrobiota timonensis]
MIATQNVSLRYGDRALFENVSIKFTEGNCYGIIGANGAGKSTFLKILAGEIEPNKGEVVITPGQRLSVLKQDHFAYDDQEVLKTVLMGNKRLYEIMLRKEELYSKADFNDEDGIELAELEGEFMEMDGWNAETDAEILLNGLQITSEYHHLLMKELGDQQKVKVLLAQALFGNPDILLLDEPTNHLDLKSVTWLENFLLNFPNTVIVVSHDRHFLNKVCTHIADIDYSKIQLYVGNYDFWYEYSQMMIKQAKEINKKAEAKKKELEEFIARFSANASKAKQATSRKKLLDNLEMVDIKPSLRRYPFIGFTPEREVGNIVLTVEDLGYKQNGEQIFDHVSFSLSPKDKVAFVSDHELAITSFFKIIMGEITDYTGSFQWGVTTSKSYFPKDNNEYFDDCDLSLVEWLRQYAGEDAYEQDLRGWLGRVLFSGEEALKKANVLSGGEKVRCMLAKMMMANTNVLVLDEPTNHLDLESIQALNEGLIRFKENVLFASHDHQFVQTIANRIIELKEDGCIDRLSTYDEYLEYKEKMEG